MGRIWLIRYIIMYPDFCKILIHTSSANLCVSISRCTISNILLLPPLCILGGFCCESAKQLNDCADTSAGVVLYNLLNFGFFLRMRPFLGKRRRLVSLQHYASTFQLSIYQVNTNFGRNLHYLLNLKTVVEQKCSVCDWY